MIGARSLLAITGIALLGTACGGGSSATAAKAAKAPIHMKAEIRLEDIGNIDKGSVTNGTICKTQGDVHGAVKSGDGYRMPKSIYADIPNAQVQVKSSTGELIGTATLPATGILQLGQSVPFGCVYKFEVTVPQSTFYTFRVGEREGPAFSHEEIAKGNAAVMVL